MAEFQAVDGDVSLSALLAYLTAEDDQGNGLDLATPTAADSVKLLTVHRAKGLEWAHVFLVGVCETRFPSNRSRTLWTSSPAVLPAPLRGDARDLPQLAGYDKAALDAYRQDTRAHDQEEELRLGYVAFTRAAHRLSVSSYLWSPRSTPLRPVALPGRGARPARRLGRAAARGALAGEAGQGRPQPVRRRRPVPPVARARPGPGGAPCASRPRAWWSRPTRRPTTTTSTWSRRPGSPTGTSSSTASSPRPGPTATRWSTSRCRPRCRRPRSRGCATEPAAFARDLARPMPRQPSPAARFGTRFHAWVEARFGQQDLFDPDELPGQADAGIDSDDDLAELIATFERGPFADRAPHAVEAPFALVLDGQVVRGRIDAVYAEPGGGYLVVDWKTSRKDDADVLQLALYRLAWAELAGVPLDQVRAAFYFVRSGRTVEPDDLPARDEIEAMLTPL